MLCSCQLLQLCCDMRGNPHRHSGTGVAHHLGAPVVPWQLQQRWGALQGLPPPVQVVIEHIAHDMLALPRCIVHKLHRQRRPSGHTASHQSCCCSLQLALQQRRRPAVCNAVVHARQQQVAAIGHHPDLQVS